MDGIILCLYFVIFTFPSAFWKGGAGKKEKGKKKKEEGKEGNMRNKLER